MTDTQQRILRALEMGYSLAVGDHITKEHTRMQAVRDAGYPTQKPVLLLERIIGLVTSPGDLVLDPFTGSGTTLGAAELLGRNSLPIVAELRANMVRVDADFSATPFKAKISNAEQLRVHTMLVIGGRDMESGAVSVRLHHGGPQGAKPKAEVVADILASIKERKA